MMSLFTATVIVFVSGLAGGLGAYAMIRDPTSLVPFAGAAVAMAIALFCVA